MSSNPGNSQSSQSSSFPNAIDNSKLEEFMMKAVGDMASCLGAMMIILGDRLGLYKAMAKTARPVTSEELANQTNTAERYIREWLASQAAAGYIVYNPKDKTFFLPPEHAMVLANEDGPAFMLGSYQILRSIFKDEDKFVEIFKTGKGLRWGEHHHDLFEGTAKFFKPNYMSNLVPSWIPSLDGVQEKLKQGAKVADIGCGYGVSTIIMAKEYPNSKFYGFDNHEGSIEAARNLAQKEGVSDRVEFSVVSANESIDNDFDLVTFFDCLHDMADPMGALKFAKQSLKSDGTCMIIEPMANDNIEDNLNLVGKIYYAASSIICVPNSLADNGIALGAQAGEKKTKNIAEKAGFTKFRRATQTPFNLVYEAKP
ncbi:MAG: class I SAM-dependent methyltransferase [Candidatus Nitrosocosmicus sp.]